MTLPEVTGSTDMLMYDHANANFLMVALRAFFDRKRLFIGIFVTCLALVAAFTVFTKRQYRSEMKFLVQNARSSPILSPDRSAASALTNVSEELLNSELEILQSQDVISKVADPTWDQKAVQDRSKAELKKHAAKLASFNKHLVVEPVGKSDVMTLTYDAPSALEARDTLASLASSYLAQHERLQRPSGTSIFYEKEAARYQKEWNSAAQDVVNFQQMHHLVSVSDIEAKLQKAIADDEGSIRNNEVKLGENTAGLEKADKLLDEVSTRQQTQQRVSPSELLIQQLKIQMATLNNKRTELLTRYTPSERIVTEVDKQIADTVEAIEKATSEKNIENTSDINPSWQTLKNSMVEGKVEYQSLLAGRDALRNDLFSLRNKLADVQALSPEFEQLRSKTEQAEANFEAFAEKRDRAHIEDAMDASKLLNVSIMENPTLPYTPAKPKPLLNLILGLPTALFLSLAALYVVEAGRSTFATPAELESAFQQSVLATIPHEDIVNSREEQPSSTIVGLLASSQVREEYRP